MHPKQTFLRMFHWYCLSLLIRQQNRIYVRVFIHRFQILLFSTIMNIKITFSLLLSLAKMAVCVERTVTSDLTLTWQALGMGSR